MQISHQSLGKPSIFSSNSHLFANNLATKKLHTCIGTPPIHQPGPDLCNLATHNILSQVEAVDSVEAFRSNKKNILLIASGHRKQDLRYGFPGFRSFRSACNPLDVGTYLQMMRPNDANSWQVVYKIRMITTCQESSRYILCIMMIIAAILNVFNEILMTCSEDIVSTPMNLLHRDSIKI